MAYRAPYIDAAGLHIPTYQEILEDMIADHKAIYGEDVYLEPDSQDYQYISIHALKIYDCMQLLEIIWNNRSVKTSVGTGLDSVVKLNGIHRKAASHSMVDLELTGDVGAEIVNGVASDESVNKWKLPEKVTFTTATVTVTAVAVELGAVKALAHEINKISTPTKGWVSVDNPAAAIPGQPIETDEALRSRQSISVATPSLSMIDSLIAGVAAVDNIQRFAVYENDTNVTDDNTVPAHSVCVVAEGGLDTDIARVIYKRKGPGTGTYGDKHVVITAGNGTPVDIKFFRAKPKPIYVAMKIKKLPGFTRDIEAAIKTNVTEYLDTLKIGQEVYATPLWAAASKSMQDLKAPSFVITELQLGESETSQNLQTVVVDFNEVAAYGGIRVEEVL